MTPLSSVSRNPWPRCCSNIGSTTSCDIRHLSLRSRICRHSAPSIFFSGSLASCQRADFLQQRPLGDVQVRVEVLAQVERERQLHRVAEDLLEVQVDAARRPVVVDVRVHVEAGVEEHDERLQPAAIERQPLLGEERVVDDALDVDGTDRDPAHVRVAQDVVHVVGGVDAGQQRLEERQPARVRLERARVALAHQVADPLGIDHFVRVERPVRAPAQPAQHVAERLADDALARPARA